jgi:hypothetical protein
MDRAQATMSFNFFAGAVESLYDPLHIIVPVGANFNQQLGVIFAVVVLGGLVSTGLGSVVSHLRRLATGAQQSNKNVFDLRKMGHGE